MSDVKYWLCCGSFDPKHNDGRAANCKEAEIGFIGRCKFGTLKEHGAKRLDECEQWGDVT